MATLRDVARGAGVSIKTASRVVNGQPGVAPETSRRVERAVERLGYVPNVSARRLVRQRAHVLGLVYENKSWNWLNDFQRGAIEEARTLGYEILMHPWNPENGGGLDLLLRTLDQGSVDGLVLTPPCGDIDSLATALERRTAPHVRIAPTRRAGDTPSVSPDDADGARRMAEHLLGLGHRRLAFIAGGPEQRSSHDREQGFRQALRKAGVRWQDVVVLRGDFSFESGLACGERLLAASPRPTAVFVSNDDMAAGVVAACHRAGVPVPGALSVSGFDDVDLARQIAPALTTIHQPTDRVAATAIRLLVARLDRRRVSDLHRTLPVRLVQRDSTGPPCT